MRDASAFFDLIGILIAYLFRSAELRAARLRASAWFIPPSPAPPLFAMATVADLSSQGESFSLLDLLLDEQQQTTAVERFSQHHANADGPLLSGHYQDLIPLTKPLPGEQYAFEVDLDACSGCKACVAACHNLNGLDESEQWRSVGLLHGGSNGGSINGSDELPILQHVTTACHHCIDPACLSGCPVMAYDKDPETGIVRHLDDQCIGCQYCIFMCPYDVPKYNGARGIVRKCDMCQDRLAVVEAPACVQSCPNGAIRIRTVNVETVVQQSESNQFLPAAPEPGITLPTTVYKSSKPLPRNLLPADYYSANRQHSHLALVIMLVLTQLSVGAFAVGQALVWGPWAADPMMLSTIRPAQAIGGSAGFGRAHWHPRSRVPLGTTPLRFPCPAGTSHVLAQP